MNGLLQDLLCSVKRRARAFAARLLRQVALVFAACLFGLAGLGFLTVSGYLALSAAVGFIWASLWMGLGFGVLAGGLLLVAKATMPRQPIPEAVPEAEVGADTEAAGDTDTLSLAAFTLAFVLARHFTDPDRD